MLSYTLFHLSSTSIVVELIFNVHKIYVIMHICNVFLSIFYPYVIYVFLLSFCDQREHRISVRGETIVSALSQHGTVIETVLIVPKLCFTSIE